ncbi:MAG: sulfatase-like hydrolase/transferase, partial [Flavobacterium sp.]
MKKTQYCNIIVFALLVMLSITVHAQTSKRPNIVIILADDMGHGDLSITGGNTPTPNIDRIVKEGVRFSNFMTSPVCTPTRGGLLTGKHPLKIGAGPETGGNLDV